MFLEVDFAQPATLKIGFLRIQVIVCVLQFHLSISIGRTIFCLNTHKLEKLRQKSGTLFGFAIQSCPNLTKLIIIDLSEYD